MLLNPFQCAKSLEWIRSFEDKLQFSKCLWPIYNKQALFWKKKTHEFKFHGFFYCAKLKRIIRVNRELWSHYIFDPNGPVLILNFFGETIKMIFTGLLACFIVQNFEKVLQAGPKLWGCAMRQNSLLRSFMSIYREKIRVKY